MRIFTARLGPLLVWQALVLAVVAVGAGVGAYVTLDTIDSDSSIAIVENQQLVPAQIGDLISTVSTDGSLSFTAVETTAFETTGKIGQVLVEEGDSVEKGQTLATLDVASLTTMKLRVAQAEVGLRDAKENLIQAAEPTDAASLTTMELRVARAEVDLRDAKENLVQAAEPASAQSIAKAESTVAKAELALEKAQDELSTLTDLDQAEADLSDSRADLALAQANLALVIDEWNDKVANAKTAVTDASVAYIAAFERWLGAPAANVDPTLTPASILTSMEADLSVLFPTIQTDTNFALLGSPPHNDPATIWDEATIFRYITFFPGAIVGECDGGTPFQGTCVRTELDAVWDSLETKRTALANAEFDASKALDSATTPVTKASDEITVAQNTLADLNSGIDTNQINVARASITVAKTDVDAAKESLVDLHAPADEKDLEVLRQSVTVAKADVDAAKESLVDLHAPADEKDLEVLRQQVVTAENELNIANGNLIGVNLVAPIAGIVSEVDMATGDAATGNQSGSITITDPSVVEIVGTVDEIDVLSITEGVLATVSLVALPDQTLGGTVSDIGSPTNNQGVVTFPVSITVDVPEGLELREGLSATASVVISQQLNVLRVPTSTIQGSFLRPFVRLSRGGEIVERPVDLGSSDNFWVIVTDGLSEGEEVLMPAPSVDSTQFAGVDAAQIQLFREIQRAGGRGGNAGGGGQRGGGQAGRGNR